MRCCKSRYLCNLEALFDSTVIEQVVFFRNNFLVTGRRFFIFTSPVARYRFLLPMNVSIFTLNIAAVCANVRPSSIYLIARSLKALYTAWREYSYMP